MTFHLVNSCPQDIDTFVSFMQYDDIPDFSVDSLQEAFDVYFGNESADGYHYCNTAENENKADGVDCGNNCGD